METEEEMQRVREADIEDMCRVGGDLIGQEAQQVPMPPATNLPAAVCVLVMY